MFPKMTAEKFRRSSTSTSAAPSPSARPRCPTCPTTAPAASSTSPRPPGSPAPSGRPTTVRRRPAIIGLTKSLAKELARQQDHRQRGGAARGDHHDRDRPHQREAGRQDTGPDPAGPLGIPRRDRADASSSSPRDAAVVHHRPGAARRRRNGDLMARRPGLHRARPRRPIVEALRTPMGKSHPRTRLVPRHPPQRDARRRLHRAAGRAPGWHPSVVEDLVIGCTAPFGEQSRNIGRNAWLQAGYPPEVPATVLDRRCGSAQTAVEMAAALVASGTHDDRHRRRRRAYGPRPDELARPRSPNSTANRGRPSCGSATTSSPQGESAELIADRWGITRGADGRIRRPLPPLAAEAVDEGRFRPRDDARCSSTARSAHVGPDHPPRHHRGVTGRR